MEASVYFLILSTGWFVWLSAALHVAPADGIDGHDTTKEYRRSFRGLSAVPRDIPPDTVKVDLRHNNMTRIGAGAFGNLSDCVELDLSFNDLTVLKRDDFSGLTSLKIYKMEGNHVRLLLPGSFERLTALILLDLSYNELESIGSGSFKGLTSLLHLDLSRNKLTSLGPHVWGDVSMTLQWLSLYRNNLQNITDGSFKPLRSLHKLSIARNALRDIHRKTFDSLNAVAYLDLHSNELSRINANTWVETFRLKTLDLHDNYISRIDSCAFANLSNLETLFLQGNHLQELKPDIFMAKDFPKSNGLPSHLKLNLMGNPLKCDSSLCWWIHYQGIYDFYKYEWKNNTDLTLMMSDKKCEYLLKDGALCASVNVSRSTETCGGVRLSGLSYPYLFVLLMWT